MGQPGKLSFTMISFIHETLYELLRNSKKILHAAGLRQGQAVLEVGCGPGFFTVPASNIVGSEGSIVAFDVNPFAVKHVQNKIAGAGATNAKAIIADAANTGLPDHSFDLAFVFGFAHPLGSMDEIWQELHRVVKLGGMLSIEGRLQPPEQYFKFETKEKRIGRYINRDSDYNK